MFVHQAQFVPVSDPSLTEQYEYANEHDIKCLVIITDAGVLKVLQLLIQEAHFCTYIFCLINCTNKTIISIACIF